MALSRKPRSPATPRRPRVAAGPRLWTWALAGALLGALAALVYFAPAAWLASAIERGTAGKVILAEPQGRVWQGSARLLLVPGGQEAVLLPERVRWTAQLQGLGLALAMLPECCASRPMEVLVQPGLRQHQATIRNLDMRLPAGLLEGLGAPFNTVGFAGQVQLFAPQLQLQQSTQGQTMQGDLRVDLVNLSSRLSSLPQLGSYRLEVQGGAVPQVQLTTTEGALQMTGQGQWSRGRFSFSGEAQAAPGYEDSLANILNVIGRRQGAVSRIQL